MKRRNFIKLSGKLSLGSVIVNKLKASSFIPEGLLRINSAVNDRCLVIIYLEGANDGLNTAVPLNQYNTYANIRPAIKIPQPSLITLDNSLPSEKQLGFHPSLTKLKNLYDGGKLNVINGVGYPNPNLSHFRSRDLWFAGEDGGNTGGLSSGWAGRLLDTNYHSLFNNPSASFKDPLGIQLGVLNISLMYQNQQSVDGSIYLGYNSPQGFYTMVSEIGTQPIANFPSSYYGNELQYIGNQEQLANKYAQRISDVFTQGANAFNSYPATDLGNQLKTIARMLAGGSRTKVFLAQITGFDTHVNQVVNGSPTIGTHNNLLYTLSEAMYAFQQDLQQLGIAERVITTTFSEFGRRPAQNASLGTDHGSLSTMFVMGGCVQGGVTGNNINLSNLDSSGNPATLVNDYRQVFTTLMQDWLGASNATVNTVGFGSYLTQKLPIVGASCIVPPSQYINPAAPLPDLVAEAGRLDEVRLIARNTWYSHKLKNTFTNPIIVCGPFSYNDANPILPRIKNVSATGFSFNATEPDYLSGTHTKTEMCSYMAVEKGRTIGNTGDVEADTISAVTNVPVTVNFSAGFADAPVVLAQVVTTNNTNVVWARVYNVTTTGFTIKLTTQKLHTGTLSAEIIHWIALEPGIVTLQNSLFSKMEVRKVTNIVDGTFKTINFSNNYENKPPILIAATQTLNEDEPCLLRWQQAGSTSVQLMIQEDASTSTPAHGVETVGIVVMNYVNSLNKFGAGNNASGNRVVLSN